MGRAALGATPGLFSRTRVFLLYIAFLWFYQRMESTTLSANRRGEALLSIASFISSICVGILLQSFHVSTGPSYFYARQQYDPAFQGNNDTRRVAFVLYGNDPRFTRGALRNAESVPLLMPGWNSRFYIDSSVSQDFIDQVHALGGETIKVNEKMRTWGEFRRAWRFLILDDPSVQYALFRDVDSRITIRELLAIHAWLKSNLPFHVMHDHPDHNIGILAGMWAAHLPTLRNRMTARSSMTAFMNNRVDMSKSGDQTWLQMNVRPFILEETLAHASYRCKEYGWNSRPFPMARSEVADYVGRIVHEKFDQGYPYHDNSASIFNGRQAPVQCRLRSEYIFG